MKRGETTKNTELLSDSNRQRAEGLGYHRTAPDSILALNTRCRSRLQGQNCLNHSFWEDPISMTMRLLFNNHQLSSLSVTDQSRLRQTDLRSRLPSVLVLTVDVAGLLIACLSALVEGKLSGKHVLFTLRVGAGGEKGGAGEGGGVVMESKRGGRGDV